MVRVLNIIGKRPIGGIGAFVYNYQSHFKSNEVIVDYLLFDDLESGPFDEKVKKLGSTVYVLPALKNTRLFFLWYKIDKFMKDVGSKYDLIHLHSVNIAFMCFTSAKKYGVKNLISHSHATVYSDKSLNALRNKILCGNLMQQANIFMACSKAAGEFLYGKQNMDKVIVFNNAIECEKFKYNEKVRHEYRKQLKLNDSFVIGNVGRFCEQKNQLFLIDIFNELVKENQNSILLLVGEGPMLEEVEKKVEKLDLIDKVKFLGTRNDVEKVLQACDVFVLPSLFEGLPVIGIEAQASGLPMVVSDAVTKELNLVDVKFVSLEESPKDWARIILLEKDTNLNRQDAYTKVALMGYEINNEAQRLEEFYIKKAK